MAEITLPIKCSTVKKLDRKITIIILVECFIVVGCAGLWLITWALYRIGYLPGAFLIFCLGIVFILADLKIFEDYIEFCLIFTLFLLNKIFVPIEKVLSHFYIKLKNFYDNLPSIECVRDDTE